VTPAEVNQYIGKPYVLGAEGPDAFDCRGLVRHVLQTYFGRVVPELPLGDALATLWSDQVTAGAWETVQAPEPGDAVVMRGGDVPHVGVFLRVDGPGILHAFEGAGQVVWTPSRALRLMGFSRLTYVRCHAAQ
jgi:cell wall-associated NlpC family hydrolase